MHPMLSPLNAAYLYPLSMILFFMFWEGGEDSNIKRDKNVEIGHFFNTHLALPLKEREME